MGLKILVTTIIIMMVAVAAYQMVGERSILDEKILKERQIISHAINVTEFPSPDNLNSPNKDIKTRGKILIWDIDSSLPSKLNNKIPKGLRANSNDTEITIFLIENGANYTRTAVVYYPSLDTAKGYIFQIRNKEDKISNLDSIILYIYYALGNSKDSSITENLIDTLQYNETDVRKYVVMSLGMRKDEKSIEIIRQLQNDSDSDIRDNANAIIESIENAKKVDKLLQDLNNEDSNIRANTARELGKMNDIRAVEPLIQLLKDGIADVRASAAEALGNIGDIRAIGELTWIQDADEDMNVRKVSEIAVQKIREKVERYQ